MAWQEAVAGVVGFLLQCARFASAMRSRTCRHHIEAEVICEILFGFFVFCGDQ